MKEPTTGAQGALEVLAFPLRLLAATLFCSFIWSGAAAQGNSITHESQRAAQVRALNNSVLEFHAHIQQNAPDAANVRVQASTVLAQRAAALQLLIQENPHAALSFAFSPELLADLAEKFPGAAPSLESHVTLTGTAVHWIADALDLKDSKDAWFLQTGAGRLELHFATTERPGTNSGSAVTIKGVQAGTLVAVSKVSNASNSSDASVSAWRMFPGGISKISNGVFFVFGCVGFAIGLARRARVWIGNFRKTPKCQQVAACLLALSVIAVSPASSPAQSCSTTGVQNYLIIMVNLPGLSLPSTVTSGTLNTLFFGPAPSVSTYVNEVSYGKASLAGTIVGPYNLTGSYDCNNWFSAIAEDAIAAAANGGANVGNYSRVFVVAPHMSCGFTALSTVGCQSTVTSAGTFNVSYTTAFPDYLFNYSGVYVAAHDGVGHQLGLGHSKLRQYTDATGAAVPLGAISDPGTILEYGDHYAVMSTYNQGHFAAPHKANLLNWMSSGTDYETVSTSGTYTIQPLEANSGLRALRVQRGTGNAGYYLWIEYRQPLGNYDSTYMTQGPYMAQVYQGAYIHYEDATTMDGSHLLDFTTPTAYNENPSLVPGQTWTDPYSDLSIAVLSADSASLTVSLSYGSASSCIHAPPSVVASPLNPSVYAGQTANYTVSVTNNDSPACAASTVGLTSNEPSGWTTSLSSTSLTLSPGQSTSFTMGKGAPSGTAAGTYAVNVIAANTNSTETDTANATVVAQPSLAVTESLAGSSFTRPGNVVINASVMSGGSPASGASVTFTLTTPTSATIRQSASTGSNGVATWNYKLSTKSVPGSYSVVATAALSASSSGGKKTASSGAKQTVSSDSVTFSVQ